MFGKINKKPTKVYAEVFYLSDRWRVRVYDKKTSKVLHDVEGLADSVDQAKAAGQKQKNKLLKQYEV